MGPRLRLGAVLLAAALAGAFVPTFAAAAPNAAPPLHVPAFQQEATRLFRSDAYVQDGGPLTQASDRALPLFQAVSVLFVVGTLLARMRSDQEQMESIAAMMLKVAFIATIPFWRVFVVETAGTIAGAIGYTSPGGTDCPLVDRLWTLLRQWAPSGSPHLDALQTASADNVPRSGDETAWAMQAWNWARGVASSTTSVFDGLWQSQTGTIRASIVLVGCGSMVVVVMTTILFTYLAELLCHLLIVYGCVILPVFIAGLGSGVLGRSSVRFIVGLGTIAFWPVAWAFGSIVTVPLIDAANQWMTAVASAASGVAPSGGSVPPLAVVAPDVSWGALCVFGATTVTMCGWNIAALVLLPRLMTRVTSAACGSATSAAAHVSAGLRPVMSRASAASAATAERSSTTVVTSAAAARVPSHGTAVRAIVIESRERATAPRPAWIDRLGRPAAATQGRRPVGE